jgi:ribosomal protein S18 acetylase RimI-like enzyme
VTANHSVAAETMRVSTLDGPQLAEYRELMLEAYEQAPDAFTTTAEERRREPDSWWLKRIGSVSGSATSFGAWDGGNLVGTVAIEYATKPKTRHSALVLGMYVKPAYRSKGAGRSLMAAAIEAAGARTEVLVLKLTLTEGNDRALRLYRSVGFEVWGIEPNAIRTESGLKGKVHMSFALGITNPRISHG